ncbi:MAG: hypothetical protein K5668_06110 [Lachnospiraceae bacterium]|nr:hypothetical protein [Lachnospiraceae bacterium]
MRREKQMIAVGLAASVAVTLAGCAAKPAGGKDYIGKLHEGYETDPKIVSETLDWLDTKGKTFREEKKALQTLKDLAQNK